MDSVLQSNKDYQSWLSDLKVRIQRSQLKASVQVNTEMIDLYWGIGADIAEKQSTEGWGSKVVPQLSRDLRNEFPGIQGFSETNLKLMRRFYGFYDKLGTSLVPNLIDGEVGYQAGTQLESSAPLAQGYSSAALPPVFYRIPWRHHVEIIRRCDTIEEATFFMKKTVENGWSRAVLLNFLDTDLYARQGKAITNFSRLLPEPQGDLAQETLKDPYRFDFITISERYRERELEDALAANITDFLIELGQGFAFMGRQIPVKVGESEAILDLLFYHAMLHCYVIVELKASSFKSDYIGQLGLYVSAVNHLMRGKLDNPTIGLLICKTKDDVMAEWSLESSSQPIGISAYELSNALPEEFESALPTIEEIEATLKGE
jgi:predicted nuclease of restriction endonuclease-like (RecB) superfamily